MKFEKTKKNSKTLDKTSNLEINKNTSIKKDPLKLNIRKFQNTKIIPVDKTFKNVNSQQEINKTKKIIFSNNRKNINQNISNKTNIDLNKNQKILNLKSIKNKSLNDFSKSILKNQITENQSINEEITDTSLLVLSNSSLESISGTAVNQEIANKENVNDHISINNTVSSFSLEINNILGKIADEEAFEEIDLIPDQDASLAEKTLPYPITNNDVYFLKCLSSTSNEVFFKNAGLNLIGENFNTTLYNSSNSNNSNYIGIFASVVSDYDITFSKFAQPSNSSNAFRGIAKISGYSFSSVNLNDRTTTTLSESYLNYDFLIIKSQIANNQQTNFNIVKTDKIVSDVAMNYFGTLQYLTFTSETDFTISDSSLLGIWGFKNNRQLRRIAILNAANFSFAETWTNYQFIFVSYYISGVLGGVLIPTNSIALNINIKFSIDGRSIVVLKNELEGTFNNVDGKLTDVEIYGINHIFENWVSSLGTSKIPTVDSSLEGGNNQEQVNKSVHADLNEIEDGTYDYQKLTLNGKVITNWPSESLVAASKSSEITDDSNLNPTLGINPSLIQINKNKEDISLKANQADLDATNANVNQNNIDLTTIEEGTYNYPQLTLSDQTITEWSDMGGNSKTSLVTLVDPSLESLSGTAINQEIANQENVNDHKYINDSIDNFNQIINNISGKVVDEEPFEEINLISNQIANLLEKTLPYPITNNYIYFLRSSTSVANRDFFANTGLNLIGENVNNSICDASNSNNSNYYGFYMNVVSDYDITFTKFAQPSNQGNSFTGIERISAYPFSNIQLNDRTTTTLSESYLNYDFLIIKSQVINNQQTTFNVVKTDKIISDVAMNYFGTLQYLTFTSETDFTISDSSLLGIWGFKNNRQLNKIAILSDTNFVFSETWTNYQFIFVSYYISGVLGGVLIPTNSITSNNENIFSIDGRNNFKLTNELEGIFSNPDGKLTDVEIYGFNHILKEGNSNINTSKIPTANSELEGGENQAEVNENVHSDLISIEEGTYNYPQLTLNGQTIEEWSSESSLTSSTSSRITDDSDLNPTLGINPSLIQVDKNTEDISLKANQSDLDATNIIVNQNNLDLTAIEEGTYNYPQLTLNGQVINNWIEGGQESNSSLINLVDSTLESISGNAINQEIANQENVNDHIVLHNTISTFTSQINNVIGRVPDEDLIEELDLIPDQVASLAEKTLFYPITDNDVYFFKSSYSNSTSSFVRNAGLNLIGENVNNIHNNASNSSNSNYYGFYMSVISDYNVTFTKFAQPSNQGNSFTGINKISGYSFSSVKLNDRTTTTLSESYLNYDFLIIKSHIINNQQTTFNIVKTDKIVSDVAMNYFGTLQYLTFTSETDFTISDSSLLGIWGFKNNHQLNRIAILSDNNFLFSEAWTNYQFIFVSYKLSGVLGGVLIPTNSIILNTANRFTIDGRNDFTLINELEGTFNNNDGKLSDTEIYGLNHIWKDGVSSINTLKLQTADSELEGGENQAEVNENVQNSLTYLETSKADKTDLDSINTVITQNSSDLEEIKDGTYDYPQLTLNGQTIEDWPSGEIGTLISSEVIDDSDINPTLGINPYLIQTQTNTENIDTLNTEVDTLNTELDTLNTQVTGIIDGTTLISFFTSALINDSGTNPDDGINPYLIQTQKNIVSINNLDTEVDTLNTQVTGIIDGTTPVVTTSNSSKITDDSEENPTEGINPYLIQIQTNTTDIENLNTEVGILNTEVEGIIDGTIPIAIDFSSSEITDDSAINPTEGINPWKTQIDTNTGNISLKADQSDLDETNIIVNQNNSDLITIKDGSYDYPKITLNGEEITEWPFIVPVSSKITDDSEENPTEGINPYLIQTQTNATEIENLNAEVGILNTEVEGIVDGTTPIITTSDSSKVTDDSATKPTEGINPYLIQTQTNVTDIENLNTEVGALNTELDTLNTEVEGIIDGTTPVVTTSDSSKVTDDSTTNPTEGINPWKTQIDENKSNIETKADQTDLLAMEINVSKNSSDLEEIMSGTYDFPQLTLNGETIETWSSGDGASISSEITDDSTTNPDDGINPYLIQTQTNTTNIESLSTELDTLNTEVEGIIDGTTPIVTNSYSSTVIDDSTTNPTEGINSYLIQTQTNATEIDALNTEVAGIIDGTTPIVTSSYSSTVIDDSTTNPTEGINPYLIQTQTNATDIESLNTEVDTLNTEVAGIKDGTIAVTTTTSTSGLIIDSEESSTEGINPYLIQTQTNADNIEILNTEVDTLNTQVTGIIDGTIEVTTTTNTSELTVDSGTNPNEGINPYLIQTQTNSDDLVDIETGVYNYPQLILNGDLITEWPSLSEINNTSVLTVVDPSVESITQSASTQAEVNIENVNDHIAIHNTINTFTEQINNAIGKISDEDAFEEINLIPGQNANLSSKTLPYPITNNNIYFLKSSTSDANVDFLKNAGFNLVEENVNNIVYNISDVNNSNYYGFYMNIVSDYDVSFTKFAEPSNTDNSFKGIKRISGYSFENTKLNDGTNTSLIESYLNYDFLIIKSQIDNNQQTTFNIVKTDKIVSDVAINYFGTLKYLTFNNETDFTIDDSSLLGIWGFKNNHQLNKIATLSDTNFVFSETWCNYQFIFISYYIDSKLSGILIPTNSLTLNNVNKFSIEGRSTFTLTDELSGTFNNIDNKLSNVEIFGINHIWKDGISSLNTSKIPTTNNRFEGGDNQAEVNRRFQRKLRRLERSINSEVIPTSLNNNENDEMKLFGYNDVDASPFIKNFDNKNGNVAELRVLTTGVDIIDGNGNALLPKSDSNITSKLYVDNLLAEKLNKTDLRRFYLQINQIKRDVLNKNNNIITNLQTQINSLVSMVDNLMLPIGSIIVGDKYLPNYGNWSLVKKLSNDNNLSKNEINNLNVYIRKS
ncbi:MAG: hypothetical protein HPAVJP_3230 [Candidatus Hepatoplasma vulgare]|nr:MAG: hypothetical protein HPAVJP_3230 [Candidatus Hepatoplasma sp.]